MILRKVSNCIDGATRLPGLVRDTYRVKSGKPIRPRLLTYTVTFRCNARCIMCDSWKMKGHADLKLDEIERIFAQIGKLDAVRLTGGEPFVRTDLPDIVSLATRYLRPLGLHITTNGFLTDRIVSFCQQRDRRIPLQILISLDGLKDQHNHIRGSSIAWDTAVDTLEQLVAKRKEWNLDLAVNQTIVDRDGLNHYRELHSFLRRRNIRHQAVLAYDQSATYNLEKEVDLAPNQVGEFSAKGDFPPDLFNEFASEIEEDLDELPWFARLAKKYYWKGIRQRMIHSPDEEPAAEGWLNPTCVALNSHMRIFPNGDVPTCQFNSKTIGNLRRQSFEEVWYGQPAQQQRSWVSRCPGCWAECEVLPNAIYSLDLLKPDLIKPKPK